MLNKLIKYDLKYINKFMIPLTIIVLCLSLINRLFNELTDTGFIFKILYITTLIALIFLIITLLFSVIIRNIIRFKNQVYGDESYLTHTLPVEKKDIIKSKIISTVLTILFTIFISLICLFIIFYSKDLNMIIKTMLNGINSYYKLKPILLFILIITIILSMIIWIIEMIYSSIILGFRHNDKKILFSFVHVIIFYIITEVLNLINLCLFALLNKDMMYLFKTNKINDKLILSLIVFIAIINVLYSVLYYFIGTKLINKKLNID